MSCYNDVNVGDETLNKNKRYLLESLLSYNIFIKKFKSKEKANYLKKEKVHLISKKWVEPFLHYFKKIKYIIKDNDGYLTLNEKIKIIDEINKYERMQDFIKSVENIHTLRKISYSEEQEHFEEYIFVDFDTDYYFQQLFKNSEYTETTLNVIIIDTNSYILEYKEYGKIEIIKQNEEFQFLKRYLVNFKSFYNVDSFELIILKKGLQEGLRKYGIDFSKKINSVSDDHGEIKIIDLLLSENNVKIYLDNNKEDNNTKYSEELIQNKLVHCIISLFVFEDSLKLNDKKNSFSEKDYFDVHLIDKNWLDKFKEKYK